MPVMSALDPRRSSLSRRIKRDSASCRNVVPEPPSFQRRQIMGGQARQRVARIIGRRDELPICPAFEIEDAVALNLGLPDGLAKIAGHGAQILANHDRTEPL